MELRRVLSAAAQPVHEAASAGARDAEEGGGYLPARSRPRYHADPDGGGATGQTRPDAARGRPPQGRTAEDRDPADSVAAEPPIPVLLPKQEPRDPRADARDAGRGNPKHLNPPRTSPPANTTTPRSHLHSYAHTRQPPHHHHT